MLEDRESGERMIINIVIEISINIFATILIASVVGPRFVALHSQFRFSFLFCIKAIFYVRFYLAMDGYKNNKRRKAREKERKKAD